MLQNVYIRAEGEADFLFFRSASGRSVCYCIVVTYNRVELLERFELVPKHSSLLCQPLLLAVLIEPSSVLKNRSLQVTATELSIIIREVIDESLENAYSIIGNLKEKKKERM